jgi:hypothetical protein
LFRSVVARVLDHDPRIGCLFSRHQGRRACPA